MEDVYDSIVIGAGPAGMTTAIYLARAGDGAVASESISNYLSNI